MRLSEINEAVQCVCVFLGAAVTAVNTVMAGGGTPVRLVMALTGITSMSHDPHKSLLRCCLCDKHIFLPTIFLPPPPPPPPPPQKKKKKMIRNYKNGFNPVYHKILLESVESDSKSDPFYIYSLIPAHSSWHFISSNNLSFCCKLFSYL